MKKKFLLPVLSLLLFSNTYAQYSISSIKRITEVTPGSTFFSVPPLAASPVGTFAEPGPDYSGIPITSRPTWFMVSSCGTSFPTITKYSFEITAYQQNTNTTDTIASIVWGPLTDTTNLVSQLNAGNIHSCLVNNNYNYSGGGWNGLSIANLSCYPKGSTYIILFCSTDSVTNIDFNSGPIYAYIDGRCGICNGKVSSLYQDLCIVAYDSASQKNMPVWEKGDSTRLETYNIYREGAVLNQFDSVGNLPSSQASLFIDQQVNPGQQSFKYKVSGRDSCGNTFLSAYSNSYHRTVHLQTNAGILGEVNLAWNAYEGFVPATYFIYRGSSQNNLALLDSISSSNTSYTDFSPLPGLNFYRLSIMKPGGCHADSNNVIYSSKSNVAYSNVTAIVEYGNAKSVILFPNPAFGNVNIDYSELKEKIITIQLFNLFGAKVQSFLPVPYKRHNLTLSATTGVYILQLKTESGSTIRKKMIIK